MNPIDYEYEVFISYRRNGWENWVKHILCEDLKQCLEDELGMGRIYVDMNLEQSGTMWPEELKDALSTSKILVPVLSTAYFTSHWCRTELAIMLERERRCGLRERGNRRGLILPIRVADGDKFPERVRVLEPAKWHDFANPRIARDSPTRERLYDEVKKLATNIKNLILDAPPFDPKWRDFIEKDYKNHYDECCIDLSAAKLIPPRL